MAAIDYITEKVEHIVRQYRTRDPFVLCDELQIRIRYKDLGTALKAYFFCQSRIKNVVINTRVPLAVGRILCAHELGHAVLHGKLAAMRGFKEMELFDAVIPTEYEANLFAAELLIDDDDLLVMLNDKEKSFFGIASELFVPVELLDFKFRMLKYKGYRLEAPGLAQGNFLKGRLPEGAKTSFAAESKDFR